MSTFPPVKDPTFNTPEEQLGGVEWVGRPAVNFYEGGRLVFRLVFLTAVYATNGFLLASYLSLAWYPAVAIGFLVVIAWLLLMAFSKWLSPNSVITPLWATTSFAICCGLVVFWQAGQLIPDDFGMADTLTLLSAAGTVYIAWQASSAVRTYVETSTLTTLLVWAAGCALALAAITVRLVLPPGEWCYACLFGPAVIGNVGLAVVVTKEIAGYFLANPDYQLEDRQEHRDHVAVLVQGDAVPELPRAKPPVRQRLVMGAALVAGFVGMRRLPETWPVGLLSLGIFGVVPVITHYLFDDNDEPSDAGHRLAVALKSVVLFLPMPPSEHPLIFRFGSLWAASLVRGPVFCLLLAFNCFAILAIVQDPPIEVRMPPLVRLVVEGQQRGQPAPELTPDQERFLEQLPKEDQEPYRQEALEAAAEQQFDEGVAAEAALLANLSPRMRKQFAELMQTVRDGRLNGRFAEELVEGRIDQAALEAELRSYFDALNAVAAKDSVAQVALRYLVAFLGPYALFVLTLWTIGGSVLSALHRKFEEGGDKPQPAIRESIDFTKISQR